MATPSPEQALAAAVAAARANTARTLEVAEQIRKETEDARAAAGAGQQPS